MTLIKKIALLIIIIFGTTHLSWAKPDLFPHSENITRQDILRGSITPERAWWDLSHYHLSVSVDPQKKFIRGTNIMKYRVLSKGVRLQIDLQPPMVLDAVSQNGEQLGVERDGSAYFITVLPIQTVGSEQTLTMQFSGIPHEAKNAPWDGGITWAKDEEGIDFIASSNQGIGSSIWWPNKDHSYDEPDNGVLMSVEVPEHLVDVSNGRLINVEHNKEKQTKTYHWQVLNPINNYGVNINIGNYVHFGEQYHGESGVLDMDYWVLHQNLDKAKMQFKEGKRTIQALEYWFGPYPFYEDSYKLVEAPYLGMEHQSSVTYGNGFKNGYRGLDRSLTGQGMLFDFIIVHETGHEWFANNITQKDVADMWIHESFTNYSESLFLEYHYDKEKAFEYIRGQRINVQNKASIIGTYNVHREGSSDMYDKGGSMLHTLRMIIDDDQKWRNILRGLNRQFRHQTVTTQQVESYISDKAGIDFDKVFDQYLRDYRLPSFEYHLKGRNLRIRWSHVVDGFNMPIRIFIHGKAMWLKPTTEWVNTELDSAAEAIKVDPNFYVNTLNLLGEG